MKINKNENRPEKAVELFMQGYNCSQAVFTAYSDIYGINKELSLKISSGLGGGVGRMREVCGAITGATMIIGLEYGCEDNSDPAKKGLVYKKVQEMAAIFKQNNSSLLCRDLIGEAAKDTSPAPNERTQEYYAKRPCTRVVYNAACALEKVLQA
ncbi:MAG: C-GCAxxG-C-C family protein [Eubacterium sp.]